MEKSESLSSSKGYFLRVLIRGTAKVVGEVVEDAFELDLELLLTGEFLDFFVCSSSSVGELGLSSAVGLVCISKDSCIGARTEGIKCEEASLLFSRSRS